MDVDYTYRSGFLTAVIGIAYAGPPPFATTLVLYPWFTPTSTHLLPTLRTFSSLFTDWCRL